MLIVLSGVESIHKRLIARTILSKLNTYHVGGFTADYSTDPVSILSNKDGKWYKDYPEFITNSPIKDKEKIQEVIKQVDLKGLELKESELKNHTFNKFMSIHYDLGISPNIQWDGEYEGHVGYADLDIADYDDIIEAYKNKEDYYMVISGIFGQAFIERLREDLGERFVKVYNIVRNPCTSWYLSHRIKGSSIAGNEMEKTFDGLYNAAILAQDYRVTTVKFEDIITSGRFMVEGKNVGIYQDYDSPNGYVTQYEYDELVPNIKVTKKAFNEFVKRAQACDLFALGSDEENDPRMADLDFKPWNLFEKLNYEPITIDTITTIPTPDEDPESEEL